ncbi:hypothetical protein ACIQW5_20995 [Methylorubrum thiocyanatum]|jgi:hypothetical protein|uniref:hypothetical protein n=1 Tax=Methylorubrum thiocyanatum TaxID=47958 RepID=UPI003839F072
MTVPPPAVAALALILASTAADAVEGLPLPSCAEVQASKLVGGALAETFDGRYPRDLADPRKVERIALDADAVANVAGYLACVAGLTDGDVNVADQGIALFASRRHGRAAFVALDAISRSDAPWAAGARAFARQMRAYRTGPG